MNVRVLYFRGCPNHGPVVEMARRLVTEHGLDSAVEEVEVFPDDVVARRFLGSPTVQVDGADIDPAARDRTDYAMSCRVYTTPDGLPSEQMLLEALGVKARRSGRAAESGLLAAAGSVASAMLSSACCWLPLVLLAFGASAAGASAMLEAWRPAFIALSLVMLGAGFYSAHSPGAACAGECCAERKPRRRRLQRVALWISAVVVAAFIFFPSYIGLLFAGGDSGIALKGGAGDPGAAREYVFDVTGMHCEGCAVSLRNELAKLEGVTAVEVDYAGGSARLRASGGGIEQRVAEAASRAGFAATAHASD